LNCARRESLIPASLNRSFQLPGWVNKDTLALIISYSGNTAETLSCFKEAIAKGCNCLGITSGGELEKLCQEHHIHYIKIPGGFPPRAALGYLMGSLLALFNRLDLIPAPEEELEESIQLLRKLSRDYSIENSPPAQMAKNILSKIPVFYTDGYWMEAVANRFRTQLAENAKTLSFTNFFPELDHNEIMGWGSPQASGSLLCLVMIRDDIFPPEIKLQMKVTAEIISGLEVPVFNIHSQGKGLLSRMLSLVHFGDWLSWHLAKIKGVDPLPIARINLLKQRLAEN
jgi:glucose/mannose-6-phosphate isomerase